MIIIIIPSPLSPHSLPVLLLLFLQYGVSTQHCGCGRISIRHCEHVLPTAPVPWVIFFFSVIVSSLSPVAVWYLYTLLRPAISPVSILLLLFPPLEVPSNASPPSSNPTNKNNNKHSPSPHQAIVPHPLPHPLRIASIILILNIVRTSSSRK